MFQALFGVFFNVLTVVVGGAAGLIFKKGIPEKFTKAITDALALCVLFIGISGTLKTITAANADGTVTVLAADTLQIILTMAVGTFLGTLLKLDDRLNALGAGIEKKLAKNGEVGNLAKGFVNATLLFCIGAMAITGSMESALTFDHSTLVAKSVIDGITAAIFASSFGAGVMLSAIPILLYEGAICVVTYLIGSAFLSDAMTLQLVTTGSLVIVGLGLNMLGLTKIKVADLLPAIFLAPILAWVVGLFA